MKTSDFDYELPEELIAQTPVEPRDHSRLMVVHRATGEREDKHFYDIIDYLRPNDALVINETKVIPARLLGEKEDTGVPVEVLLLRRKNQTDWEALGPPRTSPEARHDVCFRRRTAQMRDSGKRAGNRRAHRPFPL